MFTLLEGQMQNDQRVSRIIAKMLVILSDIIQQGYAMLCRISLKDVALNVLKVLIIIYLGVEEVFKISKSLKKRLDPYFDISQKWASQAYAILKKGLAEQKEAVQKKLSRNLSNKVNIKEVIKNGIQTLRRTNGIILKTSLGKYNNDSRRIKPRNKMR